MSFEDRIRQAVGRALDDIRTRMEQEVRALVQDLAASAAEDRQLAIAQARDESIADAKHNADQRVAEAEARLTATIDRVVADACAREREQATVQAQRAADVDASARARRLLDAVRALDAAESLSEVLEALATAVTHETGRSGVFVVRGSSFHGWSLSGFGSLDTEPGRLDVPVAHAPLVQRALETRRTAESADADAPPAGGNVPGFFIRSTGIAVPLVVADRVIAVVYADALTADGREATLTKGWGSIVELLARHAARCLAALQVQRSSTSPDRAVPTAASRPPAAERVARQRAAEPLVEPPIAVAHTAAEASEASARRLARLLISEIKLHNELSVSEGRRVGNLLATLAPEIERARRVYDARVPVTLESRAQLFQQELVMTLADGDVTRLGVSG